LALALALVAVEVAVAVVAPVGVGIVVGLLRPPPRRSSPRRRSSRDRAELAVVVAESSLASGAAVAGSWLATGTTWCSSGAPGWAGSSMFMPSMCPE
jgi:hypothetical protein